MVLEAKLRTTRVKILGLLLLVAYSFGVNAWPSKNIMIEQTLFIIGVFLISVGVLGRAWCLSYIAGNKNKKLVTEGPYSLCRNPLYFFSLAGALGVAFCSETFLLPAVILSVFAMTYRRVIKREESQLQLIFGDDYTEYMKSTPRFWPSFRGFHETTEMCISPVAFRRGLFDLTYFILLIGYFEFVEMLHQTTLIPGYFYVF
ncbi:MAG: isoprenylcysteine carboxylmethyltransferase family protein [Thermodesulfobacteriota bacterium]